MGGGVVYWHCAKNRKSGKTVLYFVYLFIFLLKAIIQLVLKGFSNCKQTE